MEIYLTFDDGVQAGTEEVLHVLQDAAVKASFFLVGNELCTAKKQQAAKLFTTLRQLYEQHDIGNHSYSHAHFYYADYYSNNGVQIDVAGTRRSILADFDQNRQLLDSLLRAALGNGYQPTERQLARLPGRNTSYARCNNQLLRRCEAGTEAIAAGLHSHGYDIFGWHLEWTMGFDFHREAVEKKRTKATSTGIDYQVADDVYPVFDMYAPEHRGKDRPTETWQHMLEKIKTLARTSNKIILLMHERAFRRDNTSPDNDLAAPLRNLINALKSMNAQFKGLSERA